MFIQKEGDMTTLTSHSLPLIPLRSSISLFSKRINVNDEICPINGVESALPRSLIRLPSPKEEQEMSPQNCYASENSQSNSICDIDTRLMNNSEPRSSSASSHKGNDNMHNDDDYMNYASDDSELSVGKEIVDDAHSSRRSILNNLNDAKMGSSSIGTAAVAAATFRMDDISSLDRTSYYQTAKHPNVVRPSPTRQEEFLRKTHLYAEEIMKHQINFMTVTKGLNISPLSPISPIRLGDNNNQTQYSSYPMPHQNSLSPIHNAAINKPLKIGFDCLQAYANDSDLGKKWSVIEDRSARSPEGTNFREIHSHLNAISKITSALGRETNIRLKMASPICTASRESSQSPPTSNSTTHMRHMLHNNFNETNLKFSIDNILKPSFGRRITDPLLKRQKPMRKSAASHRTSITNSDRINKTTVSIDSMTNLRLSMPNNNKLSMDQTTAPKLLNQLSNPMNSNNSNGNGKEPITTSATDKSSTTSSQSTINSPTSDTNSKGAIAWPAWVYCTRYSDRPSSGKNLTAYSCRTFHYYSFKLFDYDYDYEHFLFLLMQCPLTIDHSTRARVPHNENYILFAFCFVLFYAIVIIKQSYPIH